jgi:hypothetical protein
LSVVFHSAIVTEANPSSQESRQARRLFYGTVEIKRLSRCEMNTLTNAHRALAFG